MMDDRQINKFLIQNFCGIKRYFIALPRRDFFSHRRPIGIIKKNQISTILFWKDRDFDRIQIKNDSLITDSTLQYFRKLYGSINDTIKDFSMFHGDKKHKHYLHYSIPLFSQDGRLAILKYHSWCGDECGVGGISIYIKKGKKWKLFDERCSFIS